MSLGQKSFSWTDIPQEVKVGNYSSIAADCFIHQSDNHYCAENHNYVSTFNFKHAAGKGAVEIGNDVWIGRGVIMLEGVKIGDGAIVGAHTVVSKDVPPFSVFVGNPGRVVRFRFSKRVINKLMKIKWWNWEDEKVNEILPDFEDVNKFIKKYG